MNNIYSAIFAAVATGLSATSAANEPELTPRGVSANKIYDDGAREYEQSQSEVAASAIHAITGPIDKTDNKLDIDFYVSPEKYDDVHEFLKGRFIEQNFPNIDRDDVKEQAYRQKVMSESPVRYQLPPTLENGMSAFEVHELAVLTKYFPKKDYEWGIKSEQRRSSATGRDYAYDKDGAWHTFDLDELPGRRHSEEVESAEVYSNMQIKLAKAAFETTGLPITSYLNRLDQNDVYLDNEFGCEHIKVGDDPHFDAIFRVTMALQHDDKSDARLAPQIPVNAFERFSGSTFEELARRFQKAKEAYISESFKPNAHMDDRELFHHQKMVESRHRDNTPASAAAHLLSGFKNDPEFIASMNFGESQEENGAVVKPTSAPIPK
jgi:hypothetical protein